jgi:hypothetical protein
MELLSHGEVQNGDSCEQVSAGTALLWEGSFPQFYPESFFPVLTACFEQPLHKAVLIHLRLPTFL